MIVLDSMRYFCALIRLGSMNTTMVDEKEKNCKIINNNTLAAEARETQGLRCSSSVPRLSPWTRSGETPDWECSKGWQNIKYTRPKPAYGRHGLAGSWGQDTDEVSTFLVFLTSHFAPAALSSDLTNLGPLTMESDQKP